MNMNTTSNSGYEERDVNITKVILYGVGGILFLAVMIIFLVDFFIGARESIIRQSALNPISSELSKLRQRENAKLNSYGIEDSIVGRYHIPIEKAMELVAEDYRLSESGSTEK